jgi:HAD superfamily hydrolase (TIGR01509 family)
MPEITTVIFDFDGLILDTELPEYQSWCEVYERYGHALPLERWCLTVGAGRGHGFDPYAHLEELVGGPVDREAIRNRRRARSAELILELPLLDGVLDRIEEARTLGLKLGVASSSDADWVLGHLGRFGLAPSFAAVVCAGDLLRAKPQPDTYLEALSRLGGKADQALALEDSPNGIAAAKAAGLHCIAVPGSLTRDLDFSDADAAVHSLAALSLTEFRAMP